MGERETSNIVEVDFVKRRRRGEIPGRISNKPQKPRLPSIASQIAYIQESLGYTTENDVRVDALRLLYFYTIFKNLKEPFLRPASNGKLPFIPKTQKRY